MYELASRPCFFIIGVTTACFIAAGTTPDCSELLTMSVMMGASVSMLSFSMLVGIGSSSHDFEEDCTMIRLTSSADAGWNSHSSAGWYAVGGSGSRVFVIDRESVVERMLPIF